VTLHSLVPTCVHCYIPEDHNLKMMMHLWWGQCKDWKNKYVKFEVFKAVSLIEVFWNVQAMLVGKWLLLQQLFYQPTQLFTLLTIVQTWGSLIYDNKICSASVEKILLILWLHHRTSWKLIPFFYPIKVSCSYWRLVLWSNRTAHMSWIYLEKKLHTR